jgi:transcriptional regulator with XRE-family HTH domain
MANLSASDLVGIRVRQARQKRGWTAKELAGRCAKAGAQQISSTVITNLETRRRRSREVSVDELLTLAHVLEVPPLQLMLPLGAGERLEVVPGTEMDALEAARFIDGPTEPPGARDLDGPLPESTARMLRAAESGGVLALLRQADYLVHVISDRDRSLDSTPGDRTEELRLALLADRLMHVAARLDAFGYAVPVERAGEILARRGLPSTLAQWREQDSAAGYGDGRT